MGQAKDGRRAGRQARRFAFAGTAVVCWLLARGSAEAMEERLWVDAKINGTPVRLVFDSGAEVTFLFHSAADKLGLKITPPQTDESPPGKVNTGLTEPVTLTMYSQEIKCQLAVVDMPGGVQTKFDGALCWADARKNIVHIDAANLQFELLGKLPKDASKWLKFPLRGRSRILMASLPDRESSRKFVILDTGDENGVALCAPKMNLWRASHPGSARTLDASYMPGSGLTVEGIFWTEQLFLGPLEFRNVCLARCNVTQDDMGGPEFLASVGLTALKQFDVLVDGRKGFVYFKPKAAPGLPDHNRLGAVFAPITMEENDLIAHVLKDSPATDAGIRDGDVLLEIDGKSVAGWKTNPDLRPNLSFWRAPGTKEVLTLKRGDQELKETVVLRDLIGPR